MPGQVIFGRISIYLHSPGPILQLLNISIFFIYIMSLFSLPSHTVPPFFITVYDGWFSLKVLYKAISRHELRKMSWNLGPNILQTVTWEGAGHLECAGNRTGHTNPDFLYVTSTPSWTIIPKSSRISSFQVDIFVSFSSLDICIQEKVSEFSECLKAA